SSPETCRRRTPMLSALQYRHSNHVLHLDLKPDSVTMGDPPRLLHFALAQPFSGPVKLRHTMGTAPYMPPEQFMHGEVSPQSDLFGLGATLYEALTGMRPFPEGDETAIDKAQIYPQLVEDPQPLHDIIDL